MTNKIIDLSTGGGIYRVQPVGARQVVLFPGFRSDVIDLERDDDQIAIGGQEQFTTDIIR